MEIIPIKTRKFFPPKDDLFALLEESLPSLEEGDILCIASKVVAIHQGRAISNQQSAISKKTKNKKQIDPNASLTGEVGWDERNSDERRNLILSEAEWVDDTDDPRLTVKNGMFIPFAGVDESNGDGHYILWPQDPLGAAREIWEFLLQYGRGGENPSPYPLPSGARENRTLGVIIVDSMCVPLRSGTVGVAIGFWGFEPVRDYVGKEDLFGRRIEFSRADIADMIASAAVLVMGEGNESTPVAIVRGAPVRFAKGDFSETVKMDAKEDIFVPLLGGMRAGSWRVGDGRNEQQGSQSQIPSSKSQTLHPKFQMPTSKLAVSSFLHQWLSEVGKVSRPVFTLVAVSSLDGVIAPQVGKGVDWASEEDQEWFRRVLEEFDVTVLGKNTYGLLVKSQIPNSKFKQNPKHQKSKTENHFALRKRVVLTSQVEGVKQVNEHTFLLNPERVDLVSFLCERGWSTIGVTGGGGTYRYFLEQNLADHLLLTIEPLAFGTGTRLLSGGVRLEAGFELVSSIVLNARGTLLCHYRQRKTRSFP